MASGVGPAKQGEATGIWVINVLSASERQIRGDAEGAVPSPDGSLVAYRNAAGVFVIDSNGENPRSVLKAEVGFVYNKLQWSPDGKRVAVLVRRVGDPLSTVDVVSLDDGSRSELLKIADLRSFVWRSDGTLAVVTQDRTHAGSAVLHLFDEGSRSRFRSDIGPEMAVADMSVTADGNQIALVRTMEQSDVYVSEVKGKTALSDLRRLTLDDRDDRPTGWLTNSSSVLFDSNRNGSMDIFQQSVREQSAQMIIGGPEAQFGAQAAPDGERLLYWSASKNSDRLRLMTIPVKGGPSSFLFDAEPHSQFHCKPGSGKSVKCVLAELITSKLRLTPFNPADGSRGSPNEFALEGVPSIWTARIDPDYVAYVADGNIHFRGPRGSWTVSEKALPGKISALTFASDDSPELLVTVGDTRGNHLFRVKQSGASKLFSAKLQISSPLPSPDGEFLLFKVSTSSSNAWLLENF
ncbi:MAG TPA: hypothetical protein VM056_03420 [Terriglobales bacterium]|nr:hypothetical protein [Terriglobales bacterium]